MKSASSRRRGRAKPSFPYGLVLTVIVIVLNVNTLQNGFTLDDRELIQENKRIESLSAAGELFRQGYRETPLNSLYRPLTLLTFALNRVITGTGPAGFHLVNVLLHLLVIILVFRLSIRVLGGELPGFAAALVFAFHPVHVEAVANIVGRAEMLVAISVTGGLLLFFRQQNRRVRDSLGGFAGLLALFAMGLLSKEHAIVLVGLWALFRFALCNESTLPRRIRAVVLDGYMWGLVLVSVGYLALRGAVLGSVISLVQRETTFVENPLAFVSVGSRAMTAVYVLVRYVGLMFWPFHLSADYSYNTIPIVSGPWDVRFLISLGVLCSLAIAALMAAKKAPVFALGLGFFLVSVSIVSNIPFPIGTMMAERLLYLPSIALCWLIAKTVDMAGLLEWRSSRAVIPLLAVVLACWGIKTVLRNREWKDDRTLFGATLRSHPQNAKCNTIMGDTEFRVGQYPSAERYYRRALEIYPDYAGAAINLACALDAMKRHGDAVDTLLRFENKSGDLELGRRRELGRAYLGLQDYDHAVAAYESALALFDQDAIIHRNLGAIYLHLSKTDRGRFHIRRSLEIAPDQPDAQALRAILESR